MFQCLCPETGQNKHTHSKGIINEKWPKIIRFVNPRDKTKIAACQRICHCGDTIVIECVCVCQPRPRECECGTCSAVAQHMHATNASTSIITDSSILWRVEIIFGIDNGTGEACGNWRTRCGNRLVLIYVNWSMWGTHTHLHTYTLTPPAGAAVHKLHCARANRLKLCHENRACCCRTR